MSRNLYGLLVILVISGLSAVLGALVARQSLDAYVDQIQQVPLTIDALTQRRPLAIPGNYSDSLDSVEQNARPGVVPVIRPNDIAHLEGVNVSASRGVAMVMTSDGWLLTHDNVATLSNAVVFERVISGIEKSIHIPGTDLAFVKVSGDRGRVMTFGSSEDVKVGALVFVLGSDVLYPRTVASIAPRELSQSIETSELWRRFKLDRKVDEASGLPVVDASGALIGILDEEGYVRPWHTIGSLLPQAFSSDEIIINNLGLRTINRDRVFIDEIQDGLEVMSVEPRSVGGSAGVLVGDVITHIDGRDANDLPISEALIKFVGEELTLTVERNGVAQDIVINL